MKATVKQKQQNSIEYNERGIGYSQVYKNSRCGRQYASRKRSKGALSGGEITAYADLGGRAFPGADLVGVSC